MNTLKNYFTLVFLVIAFSAQAQIRYGFKTGLNFAKMEGPSEADGAGLSLESWKNVIGFHIGISFSNNFTDNFGVRGEFMYSKRGAEYKFEGPSYRIFNYDGGSSFATGKSKYLLNINTSYLDLPILGFARAGKFEFSAGGYIGLLIQAAGEGSLSFTDATTSNNLALEDIEFALNYNYRKDDIGADSGEEFQRVNVDNRNLDLPKSLGAYYDYPEGSEKYFNALDFGLVGGVSFYLSSSLYLGARFQYGLADVSNTKGDLQKSSVGQNQELIFRNDKDRHILYQVSVGFSF